MGQCFSRSQGPPRRALSESAADAENISDKPGPSPKPSPKTASGLIKMDDNIIIPYHPRRHSTGVEVRGMT